VIFVTTGTSLPFDRLIAAVDEIAPRFPEESFLAQIGDGAFQPKNMEWMRTMDERDYDRRCAASKALIALAGMGSLITAMQTGRPIVVLPRRLSLGEINTDHQIATAKRWSGRSGIFVAMEETALSDALVRALSQNLSGLQPLQTIGLVENLRSFIEND
jgi:UDP-N-acetylglucosamine transferase subunit ALG13